MREFDFFFPVHFYKSYSQFLSAMIMDEMNSSSIAENTVFYRGFVVPAASRPKPSYTDVAGFRNECLNAVGHRLASYIWQEESFNLTAVERDDVAGIPVLPYFS